MSTIWILFKKELLDIVRDGRSLFLSLVLPVALYPTILVGMGAAISLGVERLKNAPVVIVPLSDEAQALLERRPLPPRTTYQRMSREDAERALKERTVAAMVEVAPGVSETLRGGGQVLVTVLYTKRFDTSTEALRRLTPLIESLNEEELKGRLTSRALEASFVAPVKAAPVDLDFGKDIGPLIASRMLPMFLLMMLALGAIYPAVDLTAGEKERGTLETLLVSPVTPFEVMISKYLAVSALSVAATIANVASMGATFAVGLSFPGAPVSVTLSVAQLLMMLACLVPAALAVTGLALAVASTARTFKEGQSLMTPLTLMMIVPGIMAQMPGMELNLGTAAVPLLNIALLVKATVLGTVTTPHVLVTLATVVVAAILALRLAASAFESEVFRFGGGGGWRALVTQAVTATERTTTRSKTV